MNSITINDLLINLSEYNPDAISDVKKAYDYASYLHNGQVRQSGDPYISHPLNVAYILSEMHADSDTVCAGLLHDTLEDTNIKKEDIAHDFKDRIIGYSFLNVFRYVVINGQQIGAFVCEDIHLLRQDKLFKFFKVIFESVLFTICPEILFE